MPNFLTVNLSSFVCFFGGESGSIESQSDGRLSSRESVAGHSCRGADIAQSWRSGVCSVQRRLVMSTIQRHALRVPWLSYWYVRCLLS